MPRILLVDDDAALRQVYQRALTRAGFAVHAAAHGRAALTYLERQLPDLVITDLMMPELGGLHLVTAIRTQPALAAVPIVLMTGDASATAPPHYPLLRKPFALHQLLATVGGILGQGIVADTSAPGAALEIDAPLQSGERPTLDHA